MRVCPSVNQLCAYAHTVPGSLHASFQYMRHACATDYLEVGDFSEVRKDFILDTIGETSVLLICAQIFEWEYGDRFFRNCRRLRYRFGLPRQHSEVQGSKEENGERRE